MKTIYLTIEREPSKHIVMHIFTGRRWYVVRSTYDDSFALTLSNEYGRGT